MQWRFDPWVIDGIPVEVRTTVAVVLSERDTSLLHLGERPTRICLGHGQGLRVQDVQPAGRLDQLVLAEGSTWVQSGSWTHPCEAQVADGKQVLFVAGQPLRVVSRQASDPPSC